MQERNLSLDIIKTMAMFGVMCLHTQMQYYDNPIAVYVYGCRCVNTFVLYDKWLLDAWQN